MNQKVTMKKVRPISVLIVISRYPPMHTGAGLRLHRTYKRICASNYISTSVLTVRASEHQPEAERVDGADVYRMYDTSSVMVQFLRMGRELSRRRFAQVDVVHAVGESTFVVVASLWAKLLRRRLVREKAITDNSDGVTAWTSMRRWLNYPRFYYWRRMSFQRADLLIAMNRSMAAHYQQLKADPARIWLRPNPVDTSVYTPADGQERESIRASLGLRMDQVVCIAVGQFEPRKNQQFILELAKVLPEHYAFLLAGPVDDSKQGYFKQLVAFVETNRLADRVHVLSGFRQDVPDLLRCADVLLLPSTSEGTPNVMLEALCSGVPVVVNEALGLHEFIREGITGINTRLDVRSFARSVQELLGSVKQRGLCEPLTSQLRAEFGADRIDSKHVEHLRRLCGERGL